MLSAAARVSVYDSRTHGIVMSRTTVAVPLRASMRSTAIFCIASGSGMSGLIGTKASPRLSTISR